MIIKATFDDPDFFWKNFRLGTELQVSGAFVYNALSSLDSMNTFSEESECFEFLYHTSVGLERLLKILVILIEHDRNKSQTEFEKSLITHNKLELLRRVKKARKLHLGKQHNKFLSLLDTFYTSARYDRYSLASVYRPSLDQRGLMQFVSDELKMEVRNDFPHTTLLTDKIRKFIGKIIGKITSQLYDIIRIEAARQGTATYEIKYNSKAFKIFIAKEYDFSTEKLMQRETCLFLLKNLPDDGLKKYIEGIEPLEFGQLQTNLYFECMFNYHKDRAVRDEMEYLYEEHKTSRKRVEEVMALGSHVNFDEFDDFEESDFDES